MGKKTRIVLEVDSNEMFDVLAKIKDWGPCGERLTSLCLAPTESWREQVGLALYGIEVVSVERVGEESGQT